MTKTEIKSAILAYQNGTYSGEIKNLMVAQPKPLRESDIDAIVKMIGK